MSEWLERAHRNLHQRACQFWMNDCMVASRFVDTAFRTEEQVMTLSIDRLAEDELGCWQFRVTQLEMIVGELLLKNEQLRMARHPKQETNVAEARRYGMH